jgi:hypothetical protein
VSGGRRYALKRFACAFFGVACIVVALSFIDAAAHEMFAQAPARSPFDIGVREGSGPPPATGFSGWVLSEQIRFERMLSGAVRAIKADASALWTLLGISFAYGVFHAAGPGHGKAVVASYMLANERSLRRGIIISLMAAVLQGVVAVLIVGILAAVLNATSARMRDAAHAVEIASYAGIPSLRRQRMPTTIIHIMAMRIMITATRMQSPQRLRRMCMMSIAGISMRPRPICSPTRIFPGRPPR